MTEDSYRTLAQPSAAIYKEKGSSFLAYAYPVADEQAVKDHLSHLKKHHHDARHHCYAYVLGASQPTYRYNDDGEPSGTAGRPIYGQLLSFNLSHVLVVVVRYFGGTKLGTSGLIKAYKSASRSALEAAVIEEKYIESLFAVQFPYAKTSSVMNMLKKEHIRIKQQSYHEQSEIVFSIRASMAASVVNKLQELTEVEVRNE